MEYTRVYLADMLAGVIPSQIPGRGCVPDSPEANAYEEERRLYYVGNDESEGTAVCIYLWTESDLCFFRRSCLRKRSPLKRCKKDRYAVRDQRLAAKDTGQKGDRSLPPTGSGGLHRSL